MDPHILKLGSGLSQVVASPPSPHRAFLVRRTTSSRYPWRRKLGGPHGLYNPTENGQMFRLCRDLNTDSSVSVMVIMLMDFSSVFPRMTVWKNAVHFKKQRGHKTLLRAFWARDKGRALSWWPDNNREPLWLSMAILECKSFTAASHFWFLWLGWVQVHAAEGTLPDITVHNRIKQPTV
jgi:hypothetical protein